MNKKIMPTTLLLASLILMLILHFALPIKYFLWFPYNLTGLIPLAFGILINLKADKQMKLHNTTVKPYEKTSTLITKGTFFISRNPMYLGFSAILFGFVLLLRSLSGIIVVIAFPILINHFFIKFEENKLLDSFGNQWKAYCKTTGRWL